MRTEEAVSRPLWAPRAGSPGQPSQRGDKPAYRRAPWNTHFRGANGLTEVARPAGFACRWSSGAPAFHAGGDEGEMRTEEAVSRPLWAPRAGSPGQPSQRGDKPAYRRAPWNTHFRGANGLTEVARPAGFACRWSSGAPAFMPEGMKGRCGLKRPSRDLCGHPGLEARGSQASEAISPPIGGLLGTRTFVGRTG